MFLVAAGVGQSLPHESHMGVGQSFPHELHSGVGQSLPHELHTGVGVWPSDAIVLPIHC